ncbi:MAG: thioredoxin-dependent thiol peroxidase [Actinomycetota bacterium]|nr:thioredoxin-dependent thiol peroxidase [Actinomycetota bacterium]
MLTPGSVAPPFSLTNQGGQTIDLTGLRGSRVLVFFYPKANTPGCTQQACGLRDVASQVEGTVILGISPDKPAAQLKFDQKYQLGFDLLADTEHTVAEAYGVWAEKKNYGKTYMGIVRSAFLIGPDGIIEQAWYKISPADTPKKLLEAVAG